MNFDLHGTVGMLGIVNCLVASNDKRPVCARPINIHM